MVDTLSLWRSIDLGVITTSGLRKGRSICRRSMWNICAGVEGTQTLMFSSAQSSCTFNPVTYSQRCQACVPMSPMQPALPD